MLGDLPEALQASATYPLGGNQSTPLAWIVAGTVGASECYAAADQPFASDYALQSQFASAKEGAVACNVEECTVAVASIICCICSCVHMSVDVAATSWIFACHW